MARFRRWVERRDGLGDIDPSKPEPMADYGQSLESPDISDVQRLCNQVMSKNGRKFGRLLQSALDKGMLDSDLDFKNKIEELASAIAKVKNDSRGDDEKMERGMKSKRPDPFDNVVIRNPADASGGSMGGSQGGED